MRMWAVHLVGVVVVVVGGTVLTTGTQAANLHNAYGTGGVAVENPESSPALSALALLGFLYFLNLIQDVLQNNNGRRRRSLQLGQDHLEEEEEEGHYSTSYLEEEQLPEDLHQEQPEPNGVVQHSGEEGEAEARQDRMVKVSEATPRSFSFLENFFIKLPQALGIRRSKQPVERDGRDENPMGMGGFITTRLKMISSIMSFLQNPSPSRVRRTIQDFDLVGSAVEEEGAGNWLSSSIKSIQPLVREALQEYTKPRDHSTWARNQSPQRESQVETSLSGDQLNTTDSDTIALDSRKKRHTYTMNAWYGDLKGHNVEVPSGVGGLAAKVISLLGGGDELQEAVKKDAVPTFVDLSQSLVGAHPHCLQRALCHMNSHSKELSFMPRLAMQLLSTNLAEIATSVSTADDNYQAIKAGQRGEDCNESFIDCESWNTSGKD
ncbi:hypothetical protein Hamer_G009766 [Homarus americanus]|uniref:Uncharacterized protein n=1 Tax=Homarus americanus TaxID=6706 RepID=A0A8J5TNA7_HOMAM|nr:hypothetical protein Hamer_G009766 [Homarus americanus]